MRLRIASWNINSVRARLELVERFVSEQQPDLLCLQETKVIDDRFPLQAFREMGFTHHAIYGQKAYHGVAIFATDRVPFENAQRQDWCDKSDPRHLYCTLAGGVELHNFYVPAGGDVPDSSVNDKFAHKLAFLEECTAWFARRRDPANRFILLGDLNVAPLETDVWNHKQLLKVVSHTPIEVEHMGRWYASHDWVDAVRHFVPPEDRLYSWWSYRSPDWEKADKGRRLDHIWVTPALRPNLRAAWVYKAARGWALASDHAPVLLDIEL